MSAEPTLFDLGTAAGTGEPLVSESQGGDVRLYRGWLSKEEAGALFDEIHAGTTWVQERRKMYDRFVDVPRVQAWQGDDRERPWTPRVLEVRRKLEALTATSFSYVLFNRYRDGNDSVAWHNDREVEHLARPVIASLTLGATRAFDLRPKAARSRIISVDLEHGDLIVMRGETQTNWEHRVVKNRRIAGERINLTFRQLSE